MTTRTIIAPRVCEGCGDTYTRGPREEARVWALRRYCTRECATRTSKTSRRPTVADPDNSWRLRGTCAGRDPELWFADHGSWEETLAKQHCAGCPVLTQCRTWALAADERWGIWGGLDRYERAAAQQTSLAARTAANITKGD